MKWLTNQNPLAFKPFLSMPCRLMRKRQASLWHNIPLPSNFRVATQSRPLLAFCKVKHKHSGICKEVTKSWSRSRRLYQFYPNFHQLPPLLVHLAWYIRRGSWHVSHLWLFIYRHFHLLRQYRLVFLSYLTYVPFSSSYVDDLVTSV